MLHHLSTWMS